MAKLTDLFSTIMGLDSNKDYDFTIKETVSQPEPETKSEPEPETKPEPVAKPEKRNDNEVIAQLQEQVKKLEQANYALLKAHTVSTHNEMSMEDRIYCAVYGEREAK